MAANERDGRDSLVKGRKWLEYTTIVSLISLGPLDFIARRTLFCDSDRRLFGSHLATIFVVKKLKWCQMTGERIVKVHSTLIRMTITLFLLIHSVNSFSIVAQTSKDHYQRVHTSNYSGKIQLISGVTHWAWFWKTCIHNIFYDTPGRMVLAARCLSVFSCCFACMFFWIVASFEGMEMFTRG